MTDDQGWFDVGFNGNNEIQTPNIDRLASQGIILDRFYSASAVCSPTRASVLTGRNPLRLNIHHANSGHMLPEEITIPELLKPLGYTTGHFGKWHLGTFTKTFKDANRGGRPQNDIHFTSPLDHGYDRFFCTESKVPTHDPMLKPISFDEGESLRYGWKASEGKRQMETYGTYYFSTPGVAEKNNLDGSNARLIIDRVEDFISEAVEDELPIFTTIWFHTPHLPVVTDSIHRAMYDQLSLSKQIYYGSISTMDEQIGRLWDKLEKLGIAENTMLWFCSDNGPEDGTPGSAGQFRERKRSLYEGGVRVPAFVVWPGQFNAGSRNITPMVTSDYLPTISEMLNINLDSTIPLDGESVLDNLIDNESHRKNPIGFIFPQTEKTSWVNNRFKLISTNHRKDFELYDLINDPSESRNIMTAQEDIAKEMSIELSEWLESVENSAIGSDY